MILRPRQKTFVGRSLAALKEHGNTLSVASTGFGKTIALSGVTGEVLKDKDKKACILAHREELIKQNLLKFLKVNPEISVSAYTADSKSWRGRATFAMVQTLSREKNLNWMPPFDLMVIDEAHHAAADSYKAIINKARENNPKMQLFGVTATPNRGDKKGLKSVFTNVADQVTISELVATGNLVPPKTFVIDVGAQKELSGVKRLASDFDMTAVEAIMNKTLITNEVIRNWREKAGDRQTVVFCSTVKHAEDVCHAFTEDGATAAVVTGAMPMQERRSVLKAFSENKIQVLVNVAVLTEGWDHQPVSCVILLRPSSYKSTMIQMVGRGLRTVDPEEFPGVVKTDCIVLDFGTSTLEHGTLEQDVNLEGKERDPSKAPMKDCPECGGIVPLSAIECCLCGYIWEREGLPSDGPLKDFVMSEIDLLRRSNFRWCDLFGDDTALIANGFKAWGGVFFAFGRWHAIGGKEKTQPKILAVGERLVCMSSADDWLNTYESDESAHKSKRWLKLPPTEAQLKHIQNYTPGDFSMTRYKASTLLTFKFNKQNILNLVKNAA